MTAPQGIVTSYANPDTDGVASAMAYHWLRLHTDGKEFRPAFVGRYGPETLFVAKAIGIRLPATLDRIPSGVPLALVDMHHPPQMPPGAEPAAVQEVVDHHPDGVPEAFPNARIQNEDVGAAATLVAERLMRSRLRPPEQVAGLLAAAILSNTLDLTAPSTCDRDRAALAYLAGFRALPRSLVDGMFAARSDLGSVSTLEVLSSDCKVFELGRSKVAISQLETLSLDDILLRPDLDEAMGEAAKAKGADFYLFSGVDLRRRTTTLVAHDQATVDLLGRALSVTFESRRSLLPRIALRKTDLIPSLKRLLDDGDLAG